jgi:photosystem II stability/assembly factor-like uncharacterized protein
VVDGGWHSLYLWEDGYLDAAGENAYGQLGLGSSDSSVHGGTIKFPIGVTQFVAIAAGLRHSLAIGNDGWLYAWGDDSVGELGIGNAPNQTRPVKVLKVCAPLSMSGTLSVPTDFLNPYSITLTVKNNSTTVPLTNIDAFLVLAGPLAYRDSTPDQNAPPLIPPVGSNSTIWDGTHVPMALNDPLNPIYFSYIRSANSAPLLVYASAASILPGPWKICKATNVVDSITHLPLPGAELVFPGPPQLSVWSGVPFDSNKMISNAEGMFSLCIHGPIYDRGLLVKQYPINVMKENYRSTRNALTEPMEDENTFVLGPSDIQGSFLPPAPPFIGDSILKVYYPDSLLGYALSRRVIFRTLDSGVHWAAMYIADEDLHDLKFNDPGRGIVPGDAGTLVSTADSGETWLVTHIGTQNLRAVAIIDSATAWAVGDSGTLLKRSGNTWSAQPPLVKYNLTSIHFFDPDHGVIGGNGVYYLYNSGTWTRNSIAGNVTSVYYAAPGQIYFAGVAGKIIDYNDTALVTLSTDSTYTTQTINSLYFLNANIGYAAGDSGASFVTYDGGTSWATMTEFPHTTTSMNFFSLAGHGVSDNGALNYTGEPNQFTSIVRGRVTYGNPAIPIMGAEVDRYYIAVDVRDTNKKDTLSAFIDNTYTNEQGNFVFTGIDGIFHYEYRMNFIDSGIAKTDTFFAVLGKPGQIITLNYNDYTPPPPDTIVESVSSQLRSILSLGVTSSQSSVQIAYNVPESGNTRLTMQDILGRTVRVISDGFLQQGSSVVEVPIDELTTGAYYITLSSGDGSISKRFVMLR